MARFSATATRPACGGSVDRWRGGCFAPRVPVQLAYQVLFAGFAFVLGACIGSFLNVCIYRMPRDLSVNEPKRSFCPTCKYQIPWSSNLPLITWLVQRGKCRNCGAPIAARYFLVELLTGLLFLATWWRVTRISVVPVDWAQFVPLAVFVSLLVAATFIDYEHFIIPDEITRGGAAAGIVFSAIVPQLHGYVFGETQGHIYAALWSLFAAALGFALLWLVSVLGKWAFGKKTLKYDPPAEMSWTHDHEKDTAKLKVGEEEMPWEELFTNEKDVLELDCARFVFEEKTVENQLVRTQYLQLHLGAESHDLQKASFFSGVVRKLTFTRDALGFGDVKFIACIGAFLGWRAVLFTVMAASVIGALTAGITIAMGRREWSAKIPLGPYLSIGALVWMFTGPELLGWYLRLITPADPGY
jgi:leader peptidase (prepilin peptidase)/N-methyltransferase